jgi:hypothetical protein
MGLMQASCRVDEMIIECAAPPVTRRMAHRARHKMPASRAGSGHEWRRGARTRDGAGVAVRWGERFLTLVVCGAPRGVLRANHPRPDGVVACPLTFSTADKVAAGIRDTYAAGALGVALREGAPAA